MIVATLIALLVVMMLLGKGGDKTPAPVEAEAPAAAQPSDAEPAGNDLQAQAEADAAAEAAATAEAAASAAAVEQTPEKKRDFPGPALRPSPEFADQSPTEDLADAPDDRLYVTGSSVNFRAGPTTSDAVIGRLSRGDGVTAIGPRSGDWIEIRDDQGRTGFISAQFLSAQRP